MTVTNNPIVSYFKTSYEELIKVNWPARRDVVRHALLVIGISLTLAAFFGIVDYVFSWLLQRIVNR